ncbi:Oligopeptide transport system permease protein AppB [Azospirillaceae bacterium]
MSGYLARRLLQAALVLLAMSLVIYGLLGLMPGDPVDLMLSGNPRLTAADAARLRALYGLDLPLWQRYLHWLGAVVQGELGYSRLYHQPVAEVLGPRLGNTLLLMSLSLLLALALAVPAGVLAACRAGSRSEAVINLACFAGISIPPFWLALLLILLFAVGLGWLPAGGMAPAAGDGGWRERLPHLVLPVLTLTLAGVAGTTRYVRAAMREALVQDYIRTARAKGLSETRVVWRHALRNALIPVVTIVGLEFGALFSGALITETMFGWQGMGKLIYDSIMGNDFNLALIGLLLACAMTQTGNLLADLAYAVLDPRIQLAGER